MNGAIRWFLCRCRTLVLNLVLFVERFIILDPDRPYTVDYFQMRKTVFSWERVNIALCATIDQLRGPSMMANYLIMNCFRMRGELRTSYFSSSQRLEHFKAVEIVLKIFFFDNYHYRTICI